MRELDKTQMCRKGKLLLPLCSGWRAEVFWKCSCGLTSGKSWRCPLAPNSPLHSGYALQSMLAGVQGVVQEKLGCDVMMADHTGDSFMGRWVNRLMRCDKRRLSCGVTVPHLSFSSRFESRMKLLDIDPSTPTCPSPDQENGLPPPHHEFMNVFSWNSTFDGKSYKFSSCGALNNQPTEMNMNKT